jgi:hypothetical protein
MSRRFFWQIPECIKFRTVFEDAETIVGTSDDGQHRLFRKDAGKICFSEGKALASFTELFFEKEFLDKSGEVCV